jgi:hypothetical protein
MNDATLHETPKKRHDDYWLAKWHLTGTLGRALVEVDRDRGWRNGTKSAHTPVERLEKRVADVLLRELRRLGAVNDAQPEEK